MSVIGRREAILATGAAGIGSLFAGEGQKVVNKAHEFIPLRDPLGSLKEAVVLCDV